MEVKFELQTANAAEGYNLIWGSTRTAAFRIGWVGLVKILRMHIVGALAKQRQ